MKKAFSLAEILIVMTVIGVIATLTMPQLIGGIDEAHYKAGFKKAYTSIVNIAAILKAEDGLPKSKITDVNPMIDFFTALDSNLEVEGYADETWNLYKATDKATYIIKMGLKWGDYEFGDSSNQIVAHLKPTLSNWSPWIITADGMAFCVLAINQQGCRSKSYINLSSTSNTSAISNSCLIIGVDINGLKKGPNLVEPQNGNMSTNNGLTSTSKLSKLTGDRYYIYIANDGVAKGSPALTVSGRLLAGEK